MNEVGIGIAVIAGLTACAFLAQFVLGKNGPIQARWRLEANELEVQLRMMGSADEEFLEKLRSLAEVYRKLGRSWDAEQTLRRAEHICKQHWGEKNIQMVVVLQDFAKLLDSLHRGSEAAEVRKRIKAINENCGHKGVGPSH